MEEVKIVCRKCKEEKSVAEMKKDPTCKLGVTKICRLWHKKYREAQKENPEWIKKEKERHKRYNEEHREEMKQKQKKIREENKNEFFACESCQMLVKNINAHNQTEYHSKNLNNEWKDAKENFEHFQPRIVELKKMFAEWKKDLEKEKEKLEQEKKKRRKEEEETGIW